MFLNAAQFSKHWLIWQIRGFH